MPDFRYTVLMIQVLTFVALGCWFLANGETQLGVAQWLLAAVQGVIYA